MSERLFPLAMIALSLVAGVIYAWHGDVRRCVYFLAAAVLTASVVF
jgi:hypothetical protein